MIEVKALTAFTDKETGVFHKLGDSFSCGADRAKELADKKVVLVITKADAPAEEKPAEVKKPVKRAKKK